MNPPLQEISNYLSQFSFSFRYQHDPSHTAWLPNNIFNLTQSFCVVCQSMRKALRKTFGGGCSHGAWLRRREQSTVVGQKGGKFMRGQTHNPLVKGIARHPVSMGLKFKRWKTFLKAFVVWIKAHSAQQPPASRQSSELSLSNARNLPFHERRKKGLESKNS